MPSAASRRRTKRSRPGKEHADHTLPDAVFRRATPENAGPIAEQRLDSEARWLVAVGDVVAGRATGPLPPRKPAALGASALVACHVVQRLDVADAVGPCRAAVPDHLRHMVGDQNATKIHG